MLSNRVGSNAFTLRPLRAVSVIPSTEAKETQLNQRGLSSLVQRTERVEAPQLVS